MRAVLWIARPLSNECDIHTRVDFGSQESVPVDALCRYGMDQTPIMGPRARAIWPLNKWFCNLNMHRTLVVLPRPSVTAKHHNADCHRAASCMSGFRYDATQRGVQPATLYALRCNN
jgi:hypothetical protein